MDPLGEAHRGDLPESPAEPSRPNDVSAPREFEQQCDAIVRPGYTLHSPGDVAVATFLGSPLAGCIVLANNYFKLGRSVTGWQTILLGLLSTIGLVGTAIRLPAQSPPYLLPILSVIVMYGLAKGLQGSAYDQHLANGGEKASGWIAAGIGIVCLVVVLGAIMAWFYVDYEYFTTRVRFGPDEEIIYADGATESEAIKLGKVLQREGYFTGVGAKTVRITRVGDRAIVEFVMQPNAGGNAAIVKELEELKPSLSTDAFDGRPVEIHIVDENMEIQKTI